MASEDTPGYTSIVQLRLTHTRNSLPEKFRLQVSEFLQERLADSIDLMMQAKQAHWNVKGSNFTALHKLFDKVYSDAGNYVDAIAERIVQLGVQDPGSVDSRAQPAHNRLPSSGERLGETDTSKRSSTFVSTLLTFCPPGPPPRANRKSSSESGMVSVFVMIRVGRMGILVREKLVQRK